MNGQRTTMGERPAHRQRDALLAIIGYEREGGPLTVKQRLASVIQIAKAALRPGCDACGGTDDVRDRGYCDDGSPMLTCAACGGPDDA